ncbi:MAG TPA: apolipoprotein N-acyltransferase [Nitrospiria bacterium]
MIKRLPWTLSFLSGILLFFSFPRQDLGALAWVALVPLLWALDSQTPRKSFGLAYLTGLVFFLGTVHWVTNTMTRYGGMPPALSYPVMFLLVAYLALYFGFFGLLLSFLRSRLNAHPVWLLAPIIWCALEFVRTHALSGFPWAALGYSQYRYLPVIQIADVTGVAGVSFLLVLVNASIAEIIRAFGNREPIRTWGIPALTAVLSVVLTLSYGAFRISQDSAATGGTIRTGVVQANIPQDVKWDDAFREETISRYERLTRGLFSEEAELIIWPEAAMPFLLEENPAFRKRVAGLAREGKTPLLVGSPALVRNTDDIKLTNSAYLLSGEGKTLGRYDKIHLVPFGEYIPFSSILFFIEKMVEGIGDFIPGREYTLLEIPPGRIGTVICYEVIFPGLVRKIVREGADLMTTITNDAWFGDSSAPDQHFSMVVFRAVENRISFARAANTGISGFIDRTGRILQSSPTFVMAAMAEDLPLRTQTTVFTRFGDFFSILCVIISVVLTGLIIMNQTRKES